MSTDEELRDARRELDEAIAEIQRIPGFERFLASPSFTEIAGASDGGPVVYVVPAELAGFALVVRGEDVTQVGLPTISADSVRDVVVSFRDGYRCYVADRQLGYEPWCRALDQTTAWLWDVMGPILAELGATPQATLITGGLLGLLPLHAAWTPDADRPTGRRYALDDLTLTYSPNARALGRARQRVADRSGDLRLVTISDPGPDPLPYCAVEIAAAGTGFADVRHLAREDSTPSGVVAAFGAADVALLSCHAFADLEHPLDSGVVLRSDAGSGADADGTLRLRRLLLAQLDLRLAVLSACETSLPGTRLPDEVIALPTGLMQAGVGGVVASLWRVPDRASAALMSEFFRGWRHRQLTPPAALREAQRWLRDCTDEDKIEAFERAAGGDDPALPPAAAELLLDAYSLLESADPRSDAAVHRWAAFGYVGA